MALSGYVKTDGRRNGGIRMLGLFRKNDVAEFEYSVPENVYTGITPVQGAKIAVYEFREDEAEFKEEMSLPNGSPVVVHELRFFIEKMGEQAFRSVYELAQASDSGFVAVVVTYNGEAFLLGHSFEFGSERPLRLHSVTGTTGKKLKDLTGELVSLRSEDVTKARPYMGDVNELFGRG